MAKTFSRYSLILGLRSIYWDEMRNNWKSSVWICLPLWVCFPS